MYDYKYIEHLFDNKNARPLVHDTSKYWIIKEMSGAVWIIRQIPDGHYEKAYTQYNERYPFRRTNKTELRYFFNDTELEKVFNEK